MKVYDKIEDAWAALGAGQIKAVLGLGSMTTYLSKQGRLPANVHMVTSYQAILLNPVGIAVQKGNSELLGRISKSQSKLAADGTLKAIFCQVRL